MLDAIVTTAAFGPKYVALAVDLMRSFALAGNATLVVTDDPTPFDSPTIAIPCVLDEAPGWTTSLKCWHAKRHAIRAGIARARTVYFVDADNVLHEGWQDRVPKLTALPLGAHAWHQTSLGGINFRVLGRLMEAMPAALIDRIQARLGAPGWRETWWWGDYLFAVTPGETGFAFVDAWDRFVEVARGEFTMVDQPALQLAIGDGVAMAFAAHACGFTPERRVPEFAPIVRAFQHQGLGAWKRGELAPPAPG